MNLSLIKIASLNISLNRRQSSSDKKHNLSLRVFLFSPFHCCFAGSLQFSLSINKRNYFTSISEMFYTFLREKLFEKNFSRWIWILTRDSRTSMASDWTCNFSHTWKNIVRDFHWTYHCFHVWKSSFAPLNGWNSFAYENFRRSFQFI